MPCPHLSFLCTTHPFIPYACSHLLYHSFLQALFYPCCSFTLSIWYLLSIALPFISAIIMHHLGSAVRANSWEPHVESQTSSICSNTCSLLHQQVIDFEMLGFSTIVGPLLVNSFGFQTDRSPLKPSLYFPGSQSKEFESRRSVRSKHKVAFKSLILTSVIW